MDPTPQTTRGSGEVDGTPGARKAGPPRAAPRRCCLALLLVALVGLPLEAQATLHWGDFSTDSCSRLGMRQQSSVLWDIPWGASWDGTCRATGATVGGRFHAHPDRCVTSAQQWGQFDVPDSTCSPTWSNFQPNACTSDHTRQFSAYLWNIPPGVDWGFACKSSPAVVNGVSFFTPTRCVQAGPLEWGQFNMPDSSCAPFWENMHKDSCSGLRKAQFSAVLKNIFPGNSWEAACGATAATVQGIKFSSPSRCVNTTVDERGQFDVPDVTCVPRFDVVQKNECTSRGLRRYSAQILDVMPGQSAQDACKMTAMQIGLNVFNTPARCVSTDFGTWGEFNVPDASCVPKWSAVQDNGCVAKNVRKYSAQVLDVPPGQTAKNVCETMEAPVAGTVIDEVTHCVEAGAVGTWGEFYRQDESCAATKEVKWSPLFSGPCSGKGNIRYVLATLSVPPGVDGWWACSHTKKEMCDDNHTEPPLSETCGLFDHSPAEGLILGHTWIGAWGIPDDTCGIPSKPAFVTPQQHETLYATLRAKVLARHFAVGRYFRANLISLKNYVSSVAINNDNWGDLDEQAKAMLSSWNVESHERENPLMYSAQLFTALSVDYHFGRTESASIIGLGLETIRSLYPYFDDQHPDVAGWILRYSPMTSDEWAVNSNKEPTVPLNFHVDSDNQYQWSVSSGDPRSMQFRNTGFLTGAFHGNSSADIQAADYIARHDDYVRKYRGWEVSMDEISGLVGAYTITKGLVSPSNPEIDDLLVPQATRLGDYLASNGYMLIRPNTGNGNVAGGLSARGATGVLPAMEYPLSLALRNVVGKSRLFNSTLSFDEAMTKIGCAAMLNAQIPRYRAYVDTLASAGGDLLWSAFANDFGPSPQYVMARSWAAYDYRECFDVWNDEAAGEVSIASLLKDVSPTVDRFKAYLE